METRVGARYIVDISCRYRRGKELDGAANAELAHAGLQGGALHAEEVGGAAGAGDAPLGMLKRAEDVLAFGFVQSGDGTRRMSRRRGKRRGDAGGIESRSDRVERARRLRF